MNLQFSKLDGFYNTMDIEIYFAIRTGKYEYSKNNYVMLLYVSYYTLVYNRVMSNLMDEFPIGGGILK